MPIANRIAIHMEGTSLTFPTDNYLFIYANKMVFNRGSWLTFNYGTNGATAADIAARGNTVRKNFVPNAHNLLVAEYGGNNFHTTNTADNDAVIATWAAYCDEMRRSGFYVVSAGLLPQGTNATNDPVIFNANRATYVPQMRALVGVNMHAWIDWPSDPIMGQDASANDTKYFLADSTHPTGTGTSHMARIAAPVLDSFFQAADGGIPTRPAPFGKETRRMRLVF
jgi:lysophospholipase L1-like esterase